jgi:hypothetical protein
MSKLKELQDQLDRKAGIAIKESNYDRETREILDLKLTLERIQAGINEYKGLPKSSPLLKESIQNDLDRRSGAQAIKKGEKSAREDLQEGLAALGKTRAGVRSGDIISSKVQKDMDETFDIKESGPAVLSDEILHINLREATYNAELDELETILEGASAETTALFSGMKMYLNKPSPTQKRERPEGDLKSWVSTITEAWLKDSNVHARIAIHDSWLKNRLADPIAKKGLRIEVSMNNGEPAGIYWLAK